MAKRFVNEKSLAVTQGLQEISNSLGCSATALAVAWSKNHDFVASTIVGANNLSQFEEILLGTQLELTPETLAQINQLTTRFPYPLG